MCPACKRQCQAKVVRVQCVISHHSAVQMFFFPSFFSDSTPCTNTKTHTQKANLHESPVKWNAAFTTELYLLKKGFWHWTLMCSEKKHCNKRKTLVWIPHGDSVVILKNKTQRHTVTFKFYPQNTVYISINVKGRRVKCSTYRTKNRKYT